jgi:hypothetical protein
MKKLLVAALVSAQLSAGGPAFAADLTRTETQQMGAFGGLSLRIPLDGRRDRRQVRAGIAFAPMLQSRAQDGAVRTRIGEGLEFGIGGNRPPALRIGGTPVDRIGAPDGRRANISTVAWIAIGVGAAAIILVGALALCMDDSECNPSE